MLRVRGQPQKLCLVPFVILMMHCSEQHSGHRSLFSRAFGERALTFQIDARTAVRVGGFTEAPRKHMQASLSVFDVEERKEKPGRKELLPLLSSNRPCMADKNGAEILKIGRLLLEDCPPTDDMFLNYR